MITQSIVLAYHGCDAAVRDGILRGDIDGLRKSSNSYDWLGDGIYFFVGDSRRADAFAGLVAARPDLQLTKYPIKTPAVLGAYVEIGLRLDLGTVDGRVEYANGVTSVQNAQRQKSLPPLKNRPAWDGDIDLILRDLDRAAFNSIHGLRESQGLPPYDAVVSAFPQGEAVIEGGSFKKLSHLQMALCNPKCIKGWFLPPGQMLLSDSAYKDAVIALAAAKESKSISKKRIRLG